MTNETLSDKKHNAVVDELKYGYFFVKDVQHSIQKLGEELGREISTIREDMKISQMKIQMYHLIPKVIEKIFGDALIHSPLNSGKSLEDTPEGSATRTDSATSGTSDKICANHPIDKWIETLRSKGQNALRKELHEYCKNYDAVIRLKSNKRLPYTTDNPDGYRRLIRKLRKTSANPEVCPYTGKKGYVKEEDCHCFCCGSHKGVKK